MMEKGNGGTGRQIPKISFKTLNTDLTTGESDHYST